MSETKLFVIKTKAGNFKSFKELQEYCDKQYETLELALIDNKRLQEENENVRELLKKSIEALETKRIETIIKTPAEVACEMQLRRLEREALARDLTLEEAKKLDIFIKNLRFFENDKKTLECKLSNKKLLDITDSELMEIASKAIKDKNDDGSS